MVCLAKLEISQNKVQAMGFPIVYKRKKSRLGLVTTTMSKISYRFCSIALSFITALSLVLQKLFSSLIGRIYPASKHGSSFQPIRGIFSCSERIFANEIVGRKKEQMNRSICFKQ